MRTLMKVSLTAAFALGLLGLHAAQAADVPFPQGQAEAPPPQAYGPPPVAYGYPPPAVFYAPPPYVVVPGPYFVRGPYWRGYAPRYAYGYGHWGYGRRW
jgi:eukaryotic-like serine/threonine-protein kinase